MRVCTLASGSSGNCIYLGTGQTNILIDAGISCKRINDRLQEQIGITGQDIDAILLPMNILTISKALMFYQEV